MVATYISGGKTGDFIQQLSVVYEKFLIDKEPAVLYICERGDSFRHGVATAYNDLKPILSLQPYIKEFKIYQGEPYDIDLTQWRCRIDHDSYINCMKQEYGIDWGKKKWLHNIPTDSKWSSYVVINTTHYRFPDEIDWKSFSTFQVLVMFVGFEKSEHDHFVTRTNFPVGFYCPSSLFEFCVIIASCRLFIGSLSAPLSLAFGLHAPLEIGFFGKKDNHPDYRAFYNMNKYIVETIKNEPSKPRHTSFIID